MPAIPYATFVKEFLDLYRLGDKPLSTWRKMRQVLGEVGRLEIEVAGEKQKVLTTADLTTRIAGAYVQSRGTEANPNTTNGLLDYLRAACNYAVEEGYLDKAPNWRRVRPRRKKATLNPPITLEQAQRLLRVLRERGRKGGWKGRRLRAVGYFVLFTGERLNEALRTRVADVNLDARTARVVARVRLKTEQSERVVPLPVELVEELRAWMPHTGGEWLFPGVRKGNYWNGGMPGQKALDQLHAVATEAGIPKLTWHGLRHSFGTHAVQHFGVPLWAVQKILGHTDLRTTQRYLHCDDEAALVESVSKVAYR